MSRGFLLIDGSHIAHRANNLTPLTAGDMPVQAVFGFLRTLRPVIAAYSMLTPIVLWDGRSWRYDAFPGYKASRSKPPKNKTEEKARALREGLKPQIPQIKRGLSALGVRQMIAMNLEADDLAGILVRRYAPAKRIMLMTGDRDWVQLVGPGVGWWDQMSETRITEKTIEEKLGVKTPRAWLEVKALMGDISDDIPGVGGIGDKGAIQLVNEFGSVTAFINQYLDGTAINVHKKFADLAKDEDKFISFSRNMDLMDLSSPKIPPPQDLRLDPGNFSRTEFRVLCEDLGFKSILTRLDEWCDPFERKPS